MSKEILEALMQLFAIIAKQGDGVGESELEYVHNFLQQQVSSDDVEEYIAMFNEKAGIDKKGDSDKKGLKEQKRVSVIDSVRILGPSKKINKRLNQKQKVVVLVRLFEILKANPNDVVGRMEIISTVGNVFNISKEEFTTIEKFVMNEKVEDLDIENILIATDATLPLANAHKIVTEQIDGNVYILRIPAQELYFLRYTGSQDIFLNGLPVSNSRIYLFASGSTVKLPKGKPIYYSDVVANFHADITSARLSFNVNNVWYRFPNGGVGLQDISFSTSQGKLIGIMGASGAGKTTLLNVLSGIYEPSEGEVLINGIDLHKQRDQMEGVIGYIPQDDLLIEELTVFQNLFFAAKLCFDKKSDEEITGLVDQTLKSLGLFERRHLKVGSPLNKMISGGQRKRLNIALELIREPSILFVDEPTSGLSSRDSENVMELLSELTLKGKLIFVVIHQPSSNIYKMFDRMIILDTGGYLVYYGNPVEAVMYFKRIDAQVNSEQGECPVCGNVTPELLFEIMEARVVDEFGKYTDVRKVTPIKWEDYYKKNIKPEVVEPVKESPPVSSIIPSWFQQFKTYLKRDIMSKISNTQYVVLTLLEAPLLGFILSFLIRYIADPNSHVYIFYDNENIPPYIFMSIVVALFFGLIVSAEEIFRDRKILKREQFLNLSRSSYLLSKIIILILISAIQAFLYVLVANNILVVQDMFFYYWFTLFAVFVFSNMLGLNISQTFNSAVTIYVIIPLLLIPMMALGGAMFSFDKLNRALGSVDKVPWIAEFMPSRWAYEALMVNQFKNNKFEEEYYELEKIRSFSDFRTVFYLPELEQVIDETVNYQAENPDSLKDEIEMNVALIKRAFAKETLLVKGLPQDLVETISVENFDEDFAEELRGYIRQLELFYGKRLFYADSIRDARMNHLDDSLPGYYNHMRRIFHNERLADLVKKSTETHKILRYEDKLVQQIDPIFLEPDVTHLFDFRAHFYAPRKHFLGNYYSTYWFNMFVIWFMALALYPPLYYEHFQKVLNVLSKIDLTPYWEKIKPKKKVKVEKEATTEENAEKPAKEEAAKTSE